METLIKKYEFKIIKCQKVIKDYELRDTTGIFFCNQINILNTYIDSYNEIINDLKQLDNGK